MTYTGNGATSSYSFTYKIFDEGDLLVTVKDTDGVETTLTITTDYTVTINANGTGSIQLVNGGQGWLTGGNLTTDYRLVIRRVVDVVQETDIRNQGEYFPEVHENAFDYQTMIQQQQQDEINRSIKVAETDDPLTFNLPTQEERASQFLAFDANGEPIAASAVNGVAVSSYMQTVLDDTTATAARTTLGFQGTLASAGNVGTSALVDDSVTNAKLDNMGALTVKANSTNASANPTDVAASANFMQLQRYGNASEFGYPKFNVTTTVITSDATINASDYWRFASATSAATNLTMPAVASIANRVFVFTRSGTVFANAVIIRSSAGVEITRLHTDGETVWLYCDGSTFTILKRRIPTVTTDHGSATALITAVTTNPTFGTLARDKVYGRRFGEYYELDYQVAMTTNGTAGSGDYLYALPSGLTIDTTVYPATTGVIGNTNVIPMPTSGSRYWYATGPSSNAMGPALAYNTTQFRVFANTISAGLFHGSGSTQFSATISYAFTVRVKVNGWNG
jgi:hypothetical protein